uniref:Uncharacterized protein n=1 Tax=Arundo donax TaxID=35708 RepID=A0A0A9DQG7_ARUDO
MHEPSQHKSSPPLSQIAQTESNKSSSSSSSSSSPLLGTCLLSSSTISSLSLSSATNGCLTSRSSEATFSIFSTVFFLMNSCKACDFAIAGSLSADNFISRT